VLFLDFARRRVKALLDQIERLKTADFAYPHAGGAIEKIEIRINDALTHLEGLTPANDPDTVRQACSATIMQLHATLPILGFLIRSTDVRNGFELYPPLLRLARRLLGPSAKLVLSSEWSFSPYTTPYGIFPALNDFALIGLPAQESANALLIPLAGHELGHSVWRHHKFGVKVNADVQTKVHADLKSRWTEWKTLHPESKATPDSPDLFTMQSIARAIAWATRQVEETFCDLMGVALFGTSYFYAFAYLLAPAGLGRPLMYPDMRRRVMDMSAAAATFGVLVPSGFDSWFGDDVSPTTDKEAVFLLSLVMLRRYTSPRISQAKCQRS
jgi:hypothetical protein